MSNYPLVFFGTEDFSAASLKALIDGGWPILAVVTKPDSRSGRGQKLGVPAVAELAKRANLNTLQPETVAEMAGDIKQLAPIAGVLVSYGKIIPAEIIDLFPKGIINVHPSLLPLYRGPSPIETAILNGDNQTGISLMGLTPQMDAGPIFHQETVVLNSRETRPELYDSLAKAGATSLTSHLEAILSGQLKPTVQDDTKATYTKLLAKADGVIDWQEPAEVIERKVRAYQGWPKTRAKVGGHEVVITEVRVAKDADDGALVMPSQPGFIEILKIISPSGRTISGQDFLRGYSKR